MNRKLGVIKSYFSFFNALDLVLIKNKHFDSLRKKAANNINILNENYQKNIIILRVIQKFLKADFIYTKTVENKNFPTVKSNLLEIFWINDNNCENFALIIMFE